MALLLCKGKGEFAYVIKSKTVRDDASQFLPKRTAIFARGLNSLAAVRVGCNKEQILYAINVRLYDCQLFAVGYREIKGTVSPLCTR